MHTGTNSLFKEILSKSRPGIIFRSLSAQGSQYETIRPTAYSIQYTVLQEVIQVYTCTCIDSIYCSTVLVQIQEESNGTPYECCYKYECVVIQYLY